MWEPRRLTTIWVFTACYRGSFFTFYVERYTFDLPGGENISFKRMLRYADCVEARWRCYNYMMKIKYKMREGTKQLQQEHFGGNLYTMGPWLSLYALVCHFLGYKLYLIQSPFTFLWSTRWINSFIQLSPVNAGSYSCILTNKLCIPHARHFAASIETTEFIYWMKVNFSNFIIIIKQESAMIAIPFDPHPHTLFL
jgi:hypothetical protein